MKKLTVTTGKKPDQQTTLVQLRGIPSDAKLTPKLARQATRIAQGSDWPADVWDWEDDENGVGYRLYKQSARKLYCVDGNVYTKS